MGKYYWVAVTLTDEASLELDSIIFSEFESLSDSFTKNDYHITLLYSRKHKNGHILTFDNIKREVDFDEDYFLEFENGKLRLFGEEDKFIVLELFGGDGADFLHYMHSYIKEGGYIPTSKDYKDGFLPTFNVYRPHITLSEKLSDEEIELFTSLNDNERTVDLRRYSFSMKSIIEELGEVGG